MQRNRVNILVHGLLSKNFLSIIVEVTTLVYLSTLAISTRWQQNVSIWDHRP